MSVIIPCTYLDDIEVQEVFEGQTSLLLPPKAKFKLPSLSPQAMSPMRSLTPCDAGWFQKLKSARNELTPHDFTRF